MDWSYPLAPVIGWIAAGSLKFALNSLAERRLAWDRIGYGGMPSTHTTIVGTTAFLVGFKEGWSTPAFAVAATLAFIVVIDALGLRGQMGQHARALNLLYQERPEHVPLRERVGHRAPEIVVAIALSAFTAAALHALTRFPPG